MKKDKSWLLEKHRECVQSPKTGEKMLDEGYELALNDMLIYIDQLDEPEVKQLDEKIRELESYNEELIRDNNQLRNALDNQEVLSQEFIDEHEQCITGHGADKNGMSQYHHAPFVSVYDLQNLLVPKQDKPIIPKFVADYIETYKGRGFPLGAWFEFVHDEDEFENKTEEWLYSVDTQEEMLKREYLLIDAIRYGYGVEKEKLYRVRTGKSYVRFNIDGSIIGVKKDNSIVCLERLSKLPFDYKKAVESGIITLEEVKE